MRYAVLTASNRGNNPHIASKRDELNIELNELEHNIQDIDNGLAALPSGNGNFDIPNRYVLGLLVHTRYGQTPHEQVPHGRASHRHLMGGQLMGEHLMQAPRG
jgi:hypothetical protein